jgi:hypothetical protein
MRAALESVRLCGSPRRPPRDLPRGLKAWIAKIIGIFTTTLALLLGAPFWFQLLGRFVSLKGSGPTPKVADTTTAAPEIR